MLDKVTLFAAPSPLLALWLVLHPVIGVVGVVLGSASIYGLIFHFREMFKLGSRPTAIDFGGFAAAHVLLAAYVLVAAWKWSTRRWDSRLLQARVNAAVLAIGAALIGNFAVRVILWSQAEWERRPASQRGTKYPTDVWLFAGSSALCVTALLLNVGHVVFQRRSWKESLFTRAGEERVMRRRVHVAHVLNAITVSHWAILAIATMLGAALAIPRIVEIAFLAVALPLAYFFFPNQFGESSPGGADASGVAQAEALLQLPRLLRGARRPRDSRARLRCHRRAVMGVPPQRPAC